MGTKQRSKNEWDSYHSSDSCVTRGGGRLHKRPVAFSLRFGRINRTERLSPQYKKGWGGNAEEAREEGGGGRGRREGFFIKYFVERIGGEARRRAGCRGVVSTIIVASLNNAA